MTSEQIPEANVESLPLHIGAGGRDLLGATVEIEEHLRFGARTFVAYAAPNFWGPSVTVGSAIGVVTYHIEYQAIGETTVFGRVTYYRGAGGGKKVTEEFVDFVTITTANAVANVECEFKGVPLGSTVNGSISP